MRRISSVQDGSPAARYRIQPGDILVSINQEPVLDEIDYQALTARQRLEITVSNSNGDTRVIKLVKPAEKPLGLQFEDSLIGNPRTCGNNCVFCFVEQMPKGLRPSLYIKDDDWRMSLLMGNYITLTNVGEREFERIIRRKASPLYISVHATDASLREAILRNKNSALLMERLKRLKAEGLSFHCQLVLCPGLNDGEALIQSLNELLELAPAALSCAVVPVGLTRHREGLPPIRTYTKDEAIAVLGIVESFQRKALQKAGTRFAFPADEFISIAGFPIPLNETYENYAQIENGIGMLRQFEEELKTACADANPALSGASGAARVLLPCGTALEPYLNSWVKDYLPSSLSVRIVPITNHFFGDTVTVSGLITAGDLINQLRPYAADAIMICETMLNSENTLFLDDLSPDDVTEALGTPLYIFKNHGGSFIRELSRIYQQAKPIEEVKR